jgi:hypothetical protein
MIRDENTPEYKEVENDIEKANTLREIENLREYVRQHFLKPASDLLFGLLDMRQNEVRNYPI